MSKVISQGKCPHCPAWFAFTTYEDGGEHCFSCGWHRNANEYKKLSTSQTKFGVVQDSPLALPEDVSRKLPRKVLTWLRKYDITDAEIDKHNMLYSPSKELLIFPVWGSSQKLLMWQGRYFVELPRHSRYVTKGKHSDILHILECPHSDILVLTEDFISAVKVNRVANSMPLWGSQLSNQAAERLGKLYDKAYLFLDYDKRQAAIEMAVKHCFRLHIEPIIAELDPKCYNEQELRRILANANQSQNNTQGVIRIDLPGQLQSGEVIECWDTDVGHCP